MLSQSQEARKNIGAFPSQLAYVHTHGHMHTQTHTLGGQKRSLDPLELEFQVVVSHLARTLGTEHQSFVNAACALTVGPCLPPYRLLSLLHSLTIPLFLRTIHIWNSCTGLSFWLTCVCISGGLPEIFCQFRQLRHLASVPAWFPIGHAHLYSTLVLHTPHPGWLCSPFSFGCASASFLAPGVLRLNYSVFNHELLPLCLGEALGFLYWFMVFNLEKKLFLFIAFSVSLSNFCLGPCHRSPTKSYSCSTCSLHTLAS